MSDLKPCPFCGGNEVQLYIDDGLGVFSYYYEIICRHCGLSNKSIYANRDRVENAAIKHWNTRPIEDALRKEISQLQADNRSLVEQVNQMALKPNQEVIEWHECFEGVPTDSGHYLILCEDGDVYINWFNNGSDEAGNPEDHCPWGDPEWIIEVQDPGAYKVIAWAYLPKGANHE